MGENRISMEEVTRLGYTLMWTDGGGDKAPSGWARNPFINAEPISVTNAAARAEGERAGYARAVAELRTRAAGYARAAQASVHGREGANQAYVAMLDAADRIAALTPPDAVPADLVQRVAEAAFDAGYALPNDPLDQAEARRDACAAIIQRCREAR